MIDLLKRWKQFVLTLSAVYPLTLVLPPLILPLARILFPFAPQGIGGFLIAATLTALLTWVIMPRYTRLVKNWLYEEKG